MMYRFFILFFLSAILLNSTSVLALTCRNDYAGPDGCAANAAAAGMLKLKAKMNRFVFKRMQTVKLLRTTLSENICSVQIQIK